MSTDRLALQKGTEIGGYRVGKVIGRGGSSLCYEVFTKGGNRAVLKETYPIALASVLRRNAQTQVLEPAEWLDSQTRHEVEGELKIYRDRQNRELEIQREIRDAANVDNPYVFRTMEPIGDETYPYCTVMDTEGGEMLSEIMARRESDGKIKGLETAAEVFEMTRRILEAVEPVHNKRILHCDISPDNLFDF